MHRSGCAKRHFVNVRPEIDRYCFRKSRELFEETGGNTGNLAFTSAIARHFANPVIFARYEDGRDRLRASGDTLVLALANQLGPHTDLGFDAIRLEHFDLPVLGIGLGAQSPTYGDEVLLLPGTERWLRNITELAPGNAANIGVRGAFTKSQIDKRGLGGFAQITGCQSNFLNLRWDIGAKIVKTLFDRPLKITGRSVSKYIPLGIG